MSVREFISGLTARVANGDFPLDFKLVMFRVISDELMAVEYPERLQETGKRVALGLDDPFQHAKANE